MMTLEAVRARCDAVRVIYRATEEGSHRDEDRLARDVLEAVRDGVPDAREMAGEVAALMAEDRTRWYA